MYSLRRLIWMAFLVVALLLTGIALLGAYQYRLAGKYNDVINRNERILFHFMTIRETITDALISENWERLDSIIGDIEMLNSELSRLKENELISAELKLALVDKIDLTGLAILVRQQNGRTDRIERSKKLQEQLRAISDYLLQYDRIIAGQARARIVNFQMVVIGALGLIISLASLSLILLYRNTVSPLLKLSYQVLSPEFGQSGLQLTPPVAREVADLAAAVEQLARRSPDLGQIESNNSYAEALLAEAVNETTNRLNGIINYAQLLYDSSGQTGLSEEQRAMLQKIIDGGARIAGQWQKLK
ncbi:MAG TPA: hypothetical protein DDY32_10375 [Desulfobulbaceae bacterium]|nr:hypothetical protein [Desulfobulbaceae bacterium]